MDHLIDRPHYDVGSVPKARCVARKQLGYFSGVSDRRQRIAQLMGQGGEEFVLAMIGLEQ